MTIAEALARFLDQSLEVAAKSFLSALGYKSDRTVDLPSSDPEEFLQVVTQMVPGAVFDRPKALFDDWSSANLLFQLTDDDISAQNTLFKETKVAPGLLRSYLFFAVELKGDNYSRTKLTGIVRQLNRLFPMPVMVLIKHQQKKQQQAPQTVLSIAVINRAQNKREASKDVLGKVTIIQGISLDNPHRGHEDILDSLRVENLKHPQRLPINNFDTLHAAWEEIFNVELLNQRFYRELSNWFFWALPQVEFPSDIDSDSERRKATSLIRLLTRLIFCWFLKEKHLIPDDIFVEAEVRKLLKSLDDADSTFHEGILQNLFFATLNQRMGANDQGQPYRAFAKDEGFQNNKSTYGVDTLLRYEGHFHDSDQILKKLERVPFLNGGLFECLDRTDEDTGKKSYVDGFSRNAKKRPKLPNRLFFSPKLKGVDLSDAYGEPKRKNEEVRGLIHILDGYKFTIVENTPIDQEIALDPELLGKVFENLLASYNSETKTTARKQTGSFYTPRPIVDYIVDESLKSLLVQALVSRGSNEDRARAGIQNLLAYTDEPIAFSAKEQDLLLDAIHKCKILDSACGSGAFPMGMLHKLVHVIHKLDPSNSWWKQKHLDIAEQNLDSVVREAAVKQVLEIFDENDPDYGRKLYLIENCLYGADIQPIAIQITKLRFFISLIVDQRENDSKENRGIRPLPNLETKFVAANTLLALDSPPQRSILDPEVEEIERKIAQLYHQHFEVRSRPDKLRIQREIKANRKRLVKVLETSFGGESVHIANWDPFDQQQSADFFDPHWMFGQSLSEGFDIVFGNPPYVQIQKLPNDVKEQLKSYPVKKGKGKVELRPRFETFDSMGDIYCLFYERGAQLLKPGGTLSYITSNKWMRAGYGESLRGFFSTKVAVRQVVDFGGNLVFSAAMVDTVIVVAQNQHPAEIHQAVVIPQSCDIERDLGSYVAHNSVQLRNTLEGESTWVVLSPERQRIKEMVEAQGVPLEKWNINIYRGVLTGFNEAFYITNEQKEVFCREDPRCEEVLVPLLTGGDIKRYGAEWDGTWMISTFPSKDLRFESLPKPIQHHLECFRTQLTPKPKDWKGTWQGRKSGSYEWFEVQDSIGYDAEFAKPKIMYPNMTKFIPFLLDRRGFHLNDKGFIVTAENESLSYLTAVLNSTTFRCCFIDNFPNLGEDRRELRKIFFDKIPIRRPQLREVELFEPLVSLVQFARRTPENGGAGDEMRASFVEDLIDACVMECYFRDHMAERDLLFHDQIRPLLAGYDVNASRDAQLEFLHRFYETVNVPAHPIRNQLIRLTADSPDLLAVIKREGAV